MNLAGHILDKSTLLNLVISSDKKRFELTADHSKIRACQGHSIEVDLQLKPLQPPQILYHGTATRFLKSILKSGLSSQKRHHVHLTENQQTAISVGKRYGDPAILEIDAQKMFLCNHLFYRSQNGVWLTSYVPSGNIRFLEI